MSELRWWGRRAKHQLHEIRHVAVGMSQGLPLHRRAVHAFAMGLLSAALGANTLHDVLWALGDRLGKWAHR